jgi:translation initiation factor 5B
MDDWENEGVDLETSQVQAKEKKEVKQAHQKGLINIEPKQEEISKNNKTGKTKNKKNQIEETEEPEPEITSRLRSPVICILGHVDTGKTKILDKLRKTDVQGGEAGGITQQIGATAFPIDAFRHHLNKIPEKFRTDPKIPGFLIIDTPGHESFQNLRSRGSSLCDLAILVVDLMHGLQKQTLDSLDMLRKRKTPFIIALNKIDRVYQWKSTEWGGFRESYELQKKRQQKEFDDRFEKIKTHFIQNDCNVAIYDENPSMKEYINIVPTSAVTGEGMPDLIGMFVYLSQKFIFKKLEFKEVIQCTILEVKVLEKIGTTIDVILVNGTMKVGDKIIIGGLFGPIKTVVKMLLTPHPMKEMRIKSEYEHHESISGAMGIKIFANDLENALAGSPLYVYHSDEEADRYGAEITSDFNSIIKDYLSKNGKGILVQASTLGSLEAILVFLKDMKVDIAAVGLGHLQKKDVIKIQTLHAKNQNTLNEHNTILAFDVKVTADAQAYADANKIKIFTADIIYHLFDSYIDYKKQCIEERKKENEKIAVFPCILKCVLGIRKKDPIILGVDVVEGILKLGTPLIIPDKKVIIF